MAILQPGLDLSVWSALCILPWFRSVLNNVNDELISTRRCNVSGVNKRSGSRDGLGKRQWKPLR